MSRVPVCKVIGKLTQIKIHSHHRRLFHSVYPYMHVPTGDLQQEVYQPGAMPGRSTNGSLCFGSTKMHSKNLFAWSLVSHRAVHARAVHFQALSLQSPPSTHPRSDNPSQGRLERGWRWAGGVRGSAEAGLELGPRQHRRRHVRDLGFCVWATLGNP